MKSDFLIALTQLASERNLPREVVLSAIEAALASAYRKDSVTAGQNISVKLDPGSGEVSVFVLRTVVDEVTEPLLQILLADARKLKADAKVGDNLAAETMSHSAGRIAAQTAKQVVMQRLREAEREQVFLEYADKEGEVFSVNIQRIEPRQIIVDLGRAEALMPASEQVINERYRPGQKIKALLQTVQRSTKGPELIMSRADKMLVKRLFEMEVPEIYNGAVEIVVIAREPGSRSKVAVRARQDGVDPVGSCVGLRGVRIQNIVNELQGEKIDVVEWSKDPSRFISSALSPSQVLRVELNTETQSAVAIVPERQLSLAIGREGQNARLAARLTGWNVDIRSHTQAEVGEADKPKAKPKPTPTPTKEPALRAPAADKPPEEVVAAVASSVVAEAEAILKEAMTEPVTAGVMEAQQISEAEAVAPGVPDLQAPPVAQEAVVAELQTIEKLLEEAETEAAEPLSSAERSASLRDLPENIWAIRRPTPTAPGGIRFAEDIAGLKGGVTARRGRKPPEVQGVGKRRKAGKKRPAADDEA